MRFKVDHDYHIHSRLSRCSRCDEQTPERILQVSKDSGLSRICITDHYWDVKIEGMSKWYETQDFDHLALSLPLPQDPDVEFLFGCETDIDKYMRLGMPRERFDDFDFVIVPTTHLHMKGFTIFEEDIPNMKRRAELWVERFDALLNMDLPFEKIGVAHLACSLLNSSGSREDFLNTFKLIPSDDMKRLFDKAAKLGCGIELNYDDMLYSDSEAETILRPFHIAKDCGCKFYIGGDGHRTTDNIDYTKYERTIDLLGLTEDDKFILK